MLLKIHPNGAVPIYEQIVSGIVYSVAAGALEPGTLIPSVRELAEKLLVHPNTVARAFQELERSGVVIARRGRGMEVAADAVEKCQARRRALVQERIGAALAEAVASGLPAEDVRQLVDDELARVEKQVRSSSSKARKS